MAAIDDRVGEDEGDAVRCVGAHPGTRRDDIPRIDGVEDTALERAIEQLDDLTDAHRIAKLVHAAVDHRRHVELPQSEFDFTPRLLAE